MDGVLEGAAVLCACKLACSLLFLPSLADSYSAVSFCCCCLLIFTDFLVTGEGLIRTLQDSNQCFQFPHSPLIQTESLELV